ncbi:MAG: YggS family pyridoxal phosphate-dependent enzyme [Bacteroidota bacterium]
MSVKVSLDQVQQSIPEEVVLVAVSKTKPVSAIEEAYDAGHRHFGENRVQELVEKEERLSSDIKWHHIGHLQTNKVKYIASFVHLIHAVDSEKLLQEIDKQAKKHNRIIDILLQVHIAQEESKFGFQWDILSKLISDNNLINYSNVKIRGLMGMATFTHDEDQVRSEFQKLKKYFDHIRRHFNEEFSILSMGMSGDFEIAIEEGSTMVRVGSKIFGTR